MTLPTYAWVVDHPEGVIVVDTGQGTHLVESGRSFHPYHRWNVAFRIESGEEIGPRLRALGVGPRDVKRVVLIHADTFHIGGRRGSIPSHFISATARSVPSRRVRG